MDVDVVQARREWAEAYAARHRRRRRRGAAIAVALSCLAAASTYLSTSGISLSDLERIAFAWIILAAPLVMAQMAVSANLRGRGAFRHWLGVWFVALLGGAVGLANYVMTGLVLGGCLHLTVSIGVAAVLSFCLYIPPDEDFETNVVLPQILDTENWSSCASDKTELGHYREAEEMAARWLRRFGHADAMVTRDGRDNGIDVTARGAIAQVKLWSKKRAGIVEVQRLAGASSTGQQAFFFSRSGYTRQAMEWAASPERRTALFILKGDGNLRAANFLAVRALQKAPYRVARRPEPISLMSRLSLGTLGAVGAVGVPALACWVLTAPGVRTLQSLLVMGLIWVPFLVLFVATLGNDVLRLASAVHHWRTTKEWVGWRTIVEEKVTAAPEASAPPDRFVGSYEKEPIDVFLLIVGVLVAMRRLKEWTLCKLGIRWKPRVPFGFADLLAISFMSDAGSLEADWPGQQARTRRRMAAAQQAVREVQARQTRGSNT